MKIDLPIRAQGRFKLIKHTGHKFDDQGNVIEYGRVLEETGFSDNVFTYYGSAFILNDGVHELSAYVTTDATPPTIEGSSSVPPGTFSWSTSTVISSSTTRRTDPDENGFIWWRASYRFSFAPVGSSGAPSRVFRAAGVSLNSTTPVMVPIGGGANPVTSGRISQSLLEDQNGSPTTVTVDLVNEPMDLVWEFTEYVRIESKGVVRSHVQGDYSGEDLEMDHTWTLRPANFGNTSDASKGWMPISGRLFPRFQIAAGQLKMGRGSIGPVSGEIDFDPLYTADSFVYNHPTVGNPSNTVSGKFGFTSTPSGGVNAAQFMLGHTEWQITFDPPIPKQARHMFVLAITVSVVNRG